MSSIWEYKVDQKNMRTDRSFWIGSLAEERYLTGRGDEGWELIALVANLEPLLVYYWKRPGDGSSYGKEARRD